MDKVKINNQIISMRKYVKQAKIRVINKLVKEVKKLQVKHGNEQQVEKYKRKSEKLLSEIEIMKKLNIDSVSKAALIKEKDWKEVLTCKTSTVEERALALLANYDSVQSEVESFHVNNPRLVELIPDLVKHWEEKKTFRPEKNSKVVKASQLRQKKKERKFRKSQGITKVKNDSDERKRAYSTSDGCDTDERFKLQKIEEDGEVRCEELKTGLVSEESCSGEMLGIAPTKDEVLNEGISVREKKDENLSERFSSAQNVKQKRLEPKTKTQKQIACLKLDELQDRDTIPVGDEASFSEDEDDNNDSRTDDLDLKNDPFFISGDEPVVDQPGKDMSDSDSEPRQQRVKLPKRNNSDDRRGFNSKHMHPRNNRQFPERNARPNWTSGKSQFRHRGPENRRTNFQQKDFNQTFSRKPFRQTGPVNKPFPKGDSKQNSNFKTRMLPLKSALANSDFKGRGNVDQKMKPQSSDSSSSSLHPSWEAKRKLKQKEQKIAPFQGTKIKFDD